MDKVHLEQYCGDTFRFALTVKDGADNPISLTDAEVRFTLAAETAITQDSEDVLVDIDEDAGQIDISVPYTLMELPAGPYPFDVEVTFADGVRRTLVLGELLLHGDVSKEEAQA